MKSQSAVFNKKNVHSPFVGMVLLQKLIKNGSPNFSAEDVFCYANTVRRKIKKGIKPAPVVFLVKTGTASWSFPSFLFFRGGSSGVHLALSQCSMKLGSGIVGYEGDGFFGRNDERRTGNIYCLSRAWLVRGWPDRTVTLHVPASGLGIRTLARRLVNKKQRPTLSCNPSPRPGPVHFDQLHGNVLETPSRQRAASQG